MRTLIALTALAAVPAILGAQAGDSLPPDATPQTIERGRMFYEGPGLCASCHGPDGKGVATAGPNLADSVWVHSDGSYEAIVARIRTGVPRSQSQSGNRMPERGASLLTENQVRAVAAYLWTLSRSRGPQ